MGNAHGDDGAGFQPEVWPGPDRVSVPSRLRLRRPLSGLAGSGGYGHLPDGMSVTVKLDLPQAVAEKAQAEGLLHGSRLAALAEEGVERAQLAHETTAMLDEIRAQPGEPVCLEEIQKIVDEVRAERRAPA